MKSLRLRQVSVRFGAVQALSDADVKVAAGETMMLVGPNGAGKSTFIKVLLGLVRPQTGTLEVDSRQSTADRRFRAKLGYLPEAVAFSDNLSGRQVLRFFARARGLPRKRVDEVLEQVGLTAAAGRAVRGYSRGMRQRLGLGQAIISKPELLILDEPTGGLDQEGLSVLWAVLDEWQKEGRMALLATHDIALLERRVSHMCVLRAGRVIADDSPETLRRRVALPHRVHVELSEHTNGQLKEIADAIGAHSEVVTVDGRRLLAEVSPDSLIEVMAAQARFSDTVVGLRVEEAPLDLVYERLLEEPS